MHKKLFIVVVFIVLKNKRNKLQIPTYLMVNSIMTHQYKGINVIFEKNY